MSLTADIVMQLIDGYAYAEKCHQAGGDKEKSALARKLVQAAIETLVEASAPKSSLLTNYNQQNQQINQLRGSGG